MLFLTTFTDRIPENVVEKNVAVAVPLSRSCVSHGAQFVAVRLRAHAREVGAADSSSDSVRLSAEQPEKTCPLFNHGHALKTMPFLEVNGE